MNSKIKVGGNILSELSEKIPSNLVALNELIKNAYDAGAKKVSINLDSSKKTLTITDNGAGMEKGDIDTLFHISTSEKVYGEINKYKRYTQGSKGLGFLSVFKFGKKVEWITKKKSGLSFSLDFDEIVKIADIGEYEVSIAPFPTKSKGTQITISLDSYNATALYEYFSIEKNYKKILKSFYDENFVIELIIDGRKFKCEKTSNPSENYKGRQLYNVTYSSKSGKIIFFHRGNKIKTLKFPCKPNSYSLEADITIFQLPSYGKGNIDQLFLNDQDDLTPLLYVNSNLFNNYSLFNPNIMRNVKSSQSLSQMIGFIRIYSSDKLINFNSDRTQFVQNQLTDSIIKILEELNKKIQISGSEYKKYLMDLDFLSVNEINKNEFDEITIASARKFIKRDFYFKDKVNITIDVDKVNYSIFGETRSIPIVNQDSQSNVSNSITPATIQRARLEISSSFEKFIIPTDQIDLKKYITEAIDSHGHQIPVAEIAIMDGDEIIAGGILASITSPCRKFIEFRYIDPQTKLVAKSLTLLFEMPAANIITEDKDSKLINIPGHKDYKINYDENVNRLVDQINKLDIDGYLEVISCSLRTILELSVDSIATSSKTSKILNIENGLEEKINEIVTYATNKSVLKLISQASTISFHTLKNKLNSTDFGKVVSTAHLCAHKAGTYVTKEDIKSLAKQIGIFIVIVNEILGNSNIKI